MSRSQCVQNMIGLILSDTGRRPEAEQVELRYRVDHPLSVFMDFPLMRLRHANTGWEFARSLLSIGLIAPAGDGDVQVLPGANESQVNVILCRPGVFCEIQLSTWSVRRFLRKSYDLVPRGAERIDVDAALARVLDGGASC